MKFGIICLLPEMFNALNYGITGRAISSDLVNITFFNPRNYTHDKHKTVDDRPYGGGPGMVMKAPPLYDAISEARKLLPKAPVIYMTPQGKPLKQEDIQRLATLPELILLNGRYEGIDERVMQWVDQEYSIGDYIISGGELGSMIMCDAIIRCLPGALGDDQSAEQDSFSAHRLDHPHYTRPETFKGQSVPKVLQSGDHEAIKIWRQNQALNRTLERRPDLFDKEPLTDGEKKLLNSGFPRSAT